MDGNGSLLLRSPSAHSVAYERAKHTHTDRYTHTSTVCETVAKSRVSSEGNKAVSRPTAATRSEINMVMVTRGCEMHRVCQRVVQR